jgi:hypothetical protein
MGEGPKGDRTTFFYTEHYAGRIDPTGVLLWAKK